MSTTEASKAPTKRNAPDTTWAEKLIEYGNRRSKAPLDFEGAKVPKRIQTLLERAMSQSLEDMQAQVRKVNEGNGWWDDDRTVGDDIALLHSEVTEMFEAYRDHGFEDVTKTEREVRGTGLDFADDSKVTYEPIENPKPEGFGNECADVLVRLLDTCERYGVDLRAEFERKIAYNATRGHKHGGKRI